MFDLRRRQIIALLSGVGVTWSFAARAQLGERKRRIGIPWQFAADDPRTGRGLSATGRFSDGGPSIAWRVSRKDFVALSDQLSQVTMKMRPYRFEKDSGMGLVIADVARGRSLGHCLDI
jgi:hypothetical protein